MQNKFTIGVSMIVKNESSCLDKCLESVKGFNEIVVCDTGSIDNTIEIAKKYTDKVFTDFVWCDSFCKARNHSLAKMATDWVLCIDADEFLETPIENIYKIVEEAEEKGFKAIDCKVIAVSNRKSIHVQPRLFKRCPEVFWNGDIHNHLSLLGQMTTDISVIYGYSKAHELDPDRALRILKKVVNREITAQIASLPARVEMLKQTVASLRPQVHKIFVALNGYDFTPEFLKEGEYIHLDNSTGDAAKFYGVENLNGYIFLCD